MVIKKYKKNDSIHWSYLFSYWIFIWFVIYYSSFYFNSSIAKWIQNHCNPLIALWIGLIENIFSFFILYYYNTESFVLFKYIFMKFVLKVIPIYLLQNTKINIFSNSITIGILFLLYNVYLKIYGTNVIEIYQDTYQHIINNDGKTPIFNLIDTILGLK